MTAATDAHSDYSEQFNRLTGPGGPFETRVEYVLGAPMEVMKNRCSTVAELLDAAARWGDRDYVVTLDRRITFAEHACLVGSFAAALKAEYGVGPGDRVAILAANTPEWIVAFWASQALGAITVGMNGWWVAPEIEYGLGHSNPKVVIVDAKRAIRLAGVDTGGAAVLTMEEDLPRLVEQFANTTVPRVELGEDDPAVILYTSGTTGRPKGVLHSQRNLLAVTDYHRLGDARLDVLAGVQVNPGSPSDRRYLLTSPLFHIASLHNLIVPRLATGSAVIMNEGAFDADRILTLIEREGVTNWGAVPTMVSRLLDHANPDDYDLSSLVTFTLASAPSSPAFKARVREKLSFARSSMTDSYGLTECSTAIANANSADLERHPGTLGRPITTVEMEIRDPMGNRVPDGIEGEIYTRSAFVMVGYWNDAAATAHAITPDRWLKTGDHGIVENGLLRLTGRRSDLILRGGENIYPTEVEQVLDEHPAVRECAVLGIDHTEFGQEVAAVVVIDSAATVTDGVLRAYAAERLAYFKVPTHWRLVSDPLPRNATGKLLRRQIAL